MREAPAESTPQDDDDGVSARPPYARVVEARFSELSVKQQDILRRRFCDAEPATLDKVGSDHGLTRERVRQIEAQALDSLVGKRAAGRRRSRPSVSSDRGTADADSADTDPVSEAVASLARIELPITEAGFIEVGFEPLDCPTTRLLLAVAKRLGAFGSGRPRVMRHGDRQWLIAGNRTPERLVHNLTEGARNAGVVSDLIEFWGGIEEALRAHVGSDDEAAALAADVMEGLGLAEIGGQYALLGGAGVVEGLVRILRANEAPMKREVLVQYFPDRSVGTVANALLCDSRFVRVDREEFDLTESGAEARPLLRDLVYREIELYGQVAVSYLQDLAERHGYSRNSIGFYSALPDIIEDAGVLRRRRADDPPAVPEPGLDDACYQVVAGPHRGSWSCMVVVNHDRLYRGSLQIPTPLAELLEIGPGSRRVPINVGRATVHATWLHLPYLFSRELRPVLDDLGFADGDLVRFVVVGPGELHIAPMPVNRNPESPYRTLITRAGLYDGAGQPVSDSELAGALAFAVGLPPDAPLHVVDQRLNDRRNGELRDALALLYPEDLEQ
ncbi:hypothetical protein OQ968_02895 [Mycobacterium sp. 663a-19]|uniref:sigma factor-like helix-turn-helix DNA-binding protein n=1 Tax=Mycobacterium sp. 663a-19 TaxID=2986148 RepID=UPI002D1F6CCF|nr:sigma factor-like helix-turn-helix DNA-binding protein [Mycobacterium sp. 663a-19]MEB3980208.1 hypothetical protein [Mycobacterium sp. 663a-19]